MKLIYQLFAMLLIFSLGACEKIENKNYLMDGTRPVLTGSSTAVRLQAGEENNVAIRFSWTNPNYKFTTGISSHDVKYKLEIDTLGANFNSSKKYQAIFTNDLSKTYTVGELNNILGNTMRLQLDPRRSYTFQARITSSLGVGTDAVPLQSDIITFTASPFPPPPKVEVPANGTLWATGDAFASSWQNPLPAPFSTTQQFTRISTTKYELTVNMPSGGNYKLIQTQGDWGSQYHMLPGGTWAGGELEKRDADPGFPGPPSPGNYKITVDFQLGIFSVVKL
ncbi:SusE-like outer membrane protein [Lacibacter cauensis]|uniref:SusE-like outer membrane protein n=2 Tax=Lacibacter cauensis TaxID=510947 RepID=A0A562SK02_9BACT|nr:SusE-like outer membrane protein [Lacibacter cauensis]